MARRVKRKTRILRDPKTGRFLSRSKKPLRKSGKKRKRKPKQVKPIQTRHVKQLDGNENIYSVSFEFRKKQFEPSYTDVQNVFARERKYTRKSTPLAACKVNVTFKESGSQPEDSDTWITIPIGRRIAVDESGGVDELYTALVAFLQSYDVFAVHEIQISVLRL